MNQGLHALDDRQNDAVHSDIRHGILHRTPLAPLLECRETLQALTSVSLIPTL